MANGFFLGPQGQRSEPFEGSRGQSIFSPQPAQDINDPNVQSIKFGELTQAFRDGNLETIDSLGNLLRPVMNQDTVNDFNKRRNDVSTPKFQADRLTNKFVKGTLTEAEQSQFKRFQEIGLIKSPKEKSFEEKEKRTALQIGATSTDPKVQEEAATFLKIRPEPPKEEKDKSPAQKLTSAKLGQLKAVQEGIERIEKRGVVSSSAQKRLDKLKSRRDNILGIKAPLQKKTETEKRKAEVDLARAELSLDAEKGKRRTGDRVSSALSIFTRQGDDPLKVEAARDLFEFGNSSQQIQAVKFLQDKGILSDSLSVKETIDTNRTFQKQFVNTPVVKDFNTINRNFNQLNNILDKADEFSGLNALDNALITAFQKMTDPTSVVRNSEFERMQQNLAFVDRARALVSNFMLGGVLSAAERQDIKKAAEIVREAARFEADKIARDFASFADRNKLDAPFIIGSDNIERLGLGSKRQQTLSPGATTIRDEIMGNAR